ncbi:hypothetical protein A4G99_02615 [Haladaptatus sp. R4]|uniref:hypothetical protein n=1 Tax=Haladaptatus sp. R4 TaxID=1679489 RepID=UPI0007B47F13|nr:hypothetical protein [Haladaptatus sp. R4]KZN25407.1 hypothetical protein A4G99_02615 [Haladaptatus sp. R4]
MVNDGLLWEVTVNIVLGLLAMFLGRTLGVFVMGAFGFLGTVVFALLALASLVGGVYLIVRGLAILVEEIVQVEITNRA